jgi:hypothetical protein
MERVILMLCVLCIVWKSGYKTNIKCTGIYTQQMHKISYIRPFLKHYCCGDCLMMALKKRAETCGRRVCGSVAYIFHCMYRKFCMLMARMN